MSKRAKLLVRWRDNPPISEELEAVKAVLEHYAIQYTQPDHIVLHDDRLNAFPEVQGGDLTIPVSGGHKVKGFYIRRLVQALELLGVYEEIEG